MAGKKISARLLSEDVRNGLHDNDLMAKYGLTSFQLRSAFNKMLQSGLISRDSLQGRPTWEEGTDRAEKRGAGQAEGIDGETPDEHSALCPKCGQAIEPSQQECPRCGVVLSKVRPSSPESDETDGEVRPMSQQDKIAAYYYAEVSEAREAARKRRLWLVGTIVTVLVLSLLFTLIGYRREVLLLNTAGVGLFVFVYYFVILHHCFKQSTFWGVMALFIAPAAALFVIVNWNSTFQGKILPKLWVALFVLLTLLSLAM